MTSDMHPPAGPALARITLSRRRFLVIASSFAATAALAACGGDGGSSTPTAALTPVGPGSTPSAAGTPTAVTGALTIDQFMQLSKVLTDFNDLNDTDAGTQYLAALSAQAGQGAQLADLWHAGGFDGPTPPASVADLTQRGVFDNAALAALADTITTDWYSGMYSTGEDDQHVVTYTNALAWRTLGYRPAGPSSCGGAFGYWTSKPAA